MHVCIEWMNVQISSFSFQRFTQDHDHSIQCRRHSLYPNDIEPGYDVIQFSAVHNEIRRCLRLWLQRTLWGPARLWWLRRKLWISSSRSIWMIHIWRKLRIKLCNISQALPCVFLRKLKCILCRHSPINQFVRPCRPVLASGIRPIETTRGMQNKPTSV